MSSIIKVDTVQDQSGNNIINENADTITIGASGDTITIPSGATFDSSAATNTLPANVVTTDGTQTLTNKSIVATQLTGTITPSDNTVSLAKLTATGTKDATTFLRGDNTFASAGGTNTPAFQATKSSSQTVSQATTTKVTFDTETFDTNNAFASSKFTVPSGQDGKYYIYNLLLSSRSTDSDMYRTKSLLYKNGSQVQEVGLNLAATDGRDLLVNLIITLSLSAGDYLEIYTNAASSSGSSISIIGGSAITSVFGAYKLIT